MWSEEAMAPTLAHLLNSKLQWIFIGGKGGVGKTTTSCALATLFATTPIVDAAAPGGTRPRRVLLISTDPAHNLSDAFNQKLGKTPTPVKGLESTLSAMEIDPKDLLQGDIGALLGNSRLRSGGGTGSSPLAALGSIIKEAAAHLPGIDELTVFAEILNEARQLSYDVVLFDTAPTGHTLKLLALPSTLNTTMERLMSLEGIAPLIEAATTAFSSSLGGGGGASNSGSAGSTSFTSNAGANTGSDRSNSGGLMDESPLSSARFKSTMTQWHAQIKGVQEHFNDHERTAFVCVCIPEFLSVYETERLVQELMKYNISCDSLVVNQLVLKPSDAPPCRMCAARQKVQEKYLSQIDLLYEDFHVVKMPLMSEEVRGVHALGQFAKFLLEPYDADKYGYVELGSC